ncbi:HTH-type transcriptional regulator RutR [compost metagenome]
MYIRPFEDYSRAPSGVDATTTKTARASSDRTRSLILQVAGEVFASKGYAATTTADIAARAGLPKANVHYHFGSKQNLYVHVLEVVAQPYLEALSQFDDAADPREALSAYIRSKVRIAQYQPFAAKVFASELMHGARRLPKAYADALRTGTQRSLGCLQGWIDQGLLAAVEPKFLLLTIWSATQTYVNFGRQIAVITDKRQADEGDYADVVATLIRLVLRGTAPATSDATGNAPARQARVLSATAFY